MWMPLYIGDYLGDTLGLSRSEHGSYMLLIMAYWKNGGPLQTDDEQLREIAKCPPAEWARTRGLMLRFFKESNGHWTHKRIDEELQKARDMYAKKFHQTQNARLAKLAGKDTVVRTVTIPVTEDVTVNDTGLVTGIQPQPQPPSQSEQSQLPEIERRLGNLFGRKGNPITDYMELSALSEISRRKDALSEVSEIEAFHRREKKYFPMSLSKLVNNWQQYLDQARRKQKETDNGPIC